MKLDSLNETVKRPSKRLGRGIGSGKGKTAGRGTKGQKARGKIPQAFSGAGLALYKKLPRRSGMGNRSVTPKSKIIKLSKLSIFKKDSVVDLEQLIKMNLISKNDSQKGVKILADGKLEVSLTVKLPVSKSAIKEIEKAGGKVENV